MTCREKLAKEHPAIIAEMNCPHDFKYAKPPAYCPYGCKASGNLTQVVKDKLCTECWDREIPEEKQEIKPDLEATCEKLVRCRYILMDGGFTSKEAADILQRLAYAFSMNEFGVGNLSLSKIIDILKEKENEQRN